MAEPGSLIAQVLNRRFVIQQLEDIEKRLREDVDQKREGGRDAATRATWRVFSSVMRLRITLRRPRIARLDRMWD
jgi:hypothetical protein